MRIYYLSYGRIEFKKKRKKKINIDSKLFIPFIDIFQRNLFSAKYNE